MTKVHIRSALDMCAESRAACAAAKVVIVAASGTAVRARQQLTDLREEVQALCRDSRIAAAATKEMLARDTRVTEARPLASGFRSLR
jgi:hypothetical protein